MDVQPSILDRVEARLVQLGGEVRERGESHESAPVTHHFTPGLYAREIFMPKGLLITTETHKTEHPFVVSKGRVLVYQENTGEWQAIEAPHFGVTKPGTRRLLLVVFDCVWTTFHATAETDVAKIETEILAPRSNALLPGALAERRALERGAA